MIMILFGTVWVHMIKIIFGTVWVYMIKIIFGTVWVHNMIGLNTNKSIGMIRILKLFKLNFNFYNNFR